MYSPIGLTRMIPWTWAHWFFKSAVRSLTPGQRTWKSNSYSMENSQTTSGIWKGNMESNKTSKKKTVKKRQLKKRQYSWQFKLTSNSVRSRVTFSGSWTNLSVNWAPKSSSCFCWFSSERENVMQGNLFFIVFTSIWLI